MSGIIRRIDGLGRIVIPREIRKRFNIKEDDYLDISCDSNNIIISKYDLLKENEYIKILINTFSEYLNSSIVLFNRERIIYKYNDFLNNNFDFYINLLGSLKVNYIFRNKYYFIYNSIIIDSDLVGGFIIYRDYDFNDNEINISKLLLKSLIKYIEK